MTAVDPQRLAREVDALGADLGDPKALRSRVIALLDIYADRTRRTRVSANPDRAPWSFDVPPQIIRTLKQYFCERLAGRPELVWEIANELWLAAYRETQIIAADILSLNTDENVADWVEAHAAESVDNATLAALASSGLSGWRQANPQDFLSIASRWLNGENVRIRALSFYGLGAAVRDQAFENLPAIYRILRGFTQPTRGDARRAMLELVRALAQRSPAETTHFLLDRLKHGGAQAKRLARNVQEELPAAQKTAIQKALSG